MTTSHTHTLHPASHRQAAAITGFLLLLWLIVFWPTLVSTADIWMRSDTYAHGMIIPLISAWLIWRKRDALPYQPIHPFWPAWFAMAGLVALWLLARAADVLVVQQLAVVMLVPAIVMLVMGWRYTWAISFPLAYLLFAVPFGEELTLPLQMVTAEFTVAALKLSGIPVYMSGLFLEIPTGRFEVAEACSGIRYLIASLALGTLFAYLSYNSQRKRLLFMLASIIVPIIANGLRAYMIVIIAHLSDMKYATGVDHLIYGWLFFGVIIGLMFWIGSYWQDPAEATTLKDSQNEPATYDFKKGLSLASKGALLLIIAYAGAFQLQQQQQAVEVLPIELQLPDWQSVAAPAVWQPEYIGADASYLQFFREAQGQNNAQLQDTSTQKPTSGPSSDQKAVIGLYIAHYQYESQGKELINAVNRLHQNGRWTVAGQHTREIAIKGQTLAVRNLELRDLDGNKRRIWSWYQLRGEHHANPLKIKLYQALAKLIGAPQEASVYALQIDYENTEHANQRLTQFLQDNWDSLTARGLVQVAQTHN